MIIREDHKLQNYKFLALEVLSKALDDICPRYVETGRRTDPLTLLAAEQTQKVCGWIHLGQVLITKKELDDLWDKIQSDYLQKHTTLSTDRESSLTKELNADNASRIDLKLDKAMETWDKRKKSLEQRIQARRRGFQRKVLDQVPHKFSKAESKDLKVGLESSIAREIRDFEKRRETALRKIEESRNSEKVLERVMEKKVLFDLRGHSLNDSFARQEEIYNKKWAEEDLFGAALDWFINDIDKVNRWCTVAGVPLMVCYKGVQERLQFLNYPSPEIDDIVARIKSGEINQYDLEELGVDLFTNSSYNARNDLSKQT